MRLSRFLVTGVVATLAVVTAVVAAAAVLPGDPDKTVMRTGFTWDFGFLDGDELTVYGTKLPPCTYLEDPAALAVSDGPWQSISLTGHVDIASGCPSPIFSKSGLSVSDKNGSPAVEVKLGDVVSPSRIKDAIGGMIRPVYARSELPIRLGSGGAHLFLQGAHSTDGELAEFGGEFDWTGYDTTPPTHLELKFRGLGLSPATPPMGEVVKIGSQGGWLAPQANGKSYRFVWFAPRGETWIGYELYPTNNATTKADLIATLRKLNWG